MNDKLLACAQYGLNLEQYWLKREHMLDLYLTMFPKT